jgi:hypothetical protein
MYFGQAIPVRQDISASVLGMGIPNCVTSHPAPMYDTGLLAYAKTLLGSKNFDNHDLSAGKDSDNAFGQCLRACQCPSPSLYVPALWQSCRHLCDKSVPSLAVRRPQVAYVSK